MSGRCLAFFRSAHFRNGIAGKASPLTSGVSPQVPPEERRPRLSNSRGRFIKRVGHSMLTDAAILLLVFAAGYGLRAWISARRRHAIRKARGGD